MYRHVNPHDHDFASLMYVDESKSKAIVFNYLVSNRQRLTEIFQPVRFSGLDPEKKYTVKEINLYPGAKSRINGDVIYTGDFLMNVGFNAELSGQRSSVVLDVSVVK
jgi:alpha-galactosidase